MHRFFLICTVDEAWRNLNTVSVEAVANLQISVSHRTMGGAASSTQTSNEVQARHQSTTAVSGLVAADPKWTPSHVLSKVSLGTTSGVTKNHVVPVAATYPFSDRGIQEMGTLNGWQTEIALMIPGRSFPNRVLKKRSPFEWQLLPGGLWISIWIRAAMLTSQKFILKFHFHRCSTSKLQNP